MTVFSFNRIDNKKIYFAQIMFTYFFYVRRQCNSVEKLYFLSILSSKIFFLVIKLFFLENRLNFNFLFLYQVEKYF